MYNADNAALLRNIWLLVGRSHVGLSQSHCLVSCFVTLIASFIDLASHCRLMFHDKPKHTRLWRWCALYPLYVMAEVAIISTDLAELLGSAIALCLLIPKLQLWQGVILTAFDVLILLALGDPLRGKPAKFFEWIIAGMVGCSLTIITRSYSHASRFSQC